MPLYEYLCPACHQRFEVLQRIGASADEVRCPECGAEKVERRLSTFAAAVGSATSSSYGDAGGGCGRPACGTGFT